MNDPDKNDMEKTANDQTMTPQEGAEGPGSAQERQQDEARADLQAQIETLKAENADLQDKLLRSFAEMENLRRRTEREKADNAKYAISEFARDVIGIGDNLRRAIEAVPKDAASSDPALKTLIEGVEVTERELFKVLERHGITRFDPKGEKFDPHIHDAMMRMETADQPPDTIVQVIHAGYMIGERVLRPAAVIVAKASMGASATSAPPDSEPSKEQAQGSSAPPENGPPNNGESGTASPEQPTPKPGLSSRPENSYSAAPSRPAGRPHGTPPVTYLRSSRRQDPAIDSASGFQGHRAQVLRPVNVTTSVLQSNKRPSSMMKPVISPNGLREPDEAAPSRGPKYNED